MNNGVCTNLPSLCSKAASKESIVMSTPDARCPECNASLMVAGGNSRNSTNIKLIISALVGLLVIALGAFFFFKGNSEKTSTSAGPEKTSPISVSQPDLLQLRLSGSNTLGASLAPALVEAFLKQEGYGELQRRPGKDHEESEILASSNGKKGQVLISAHGSGTAFSGLRDGVADIGMSSRPIRKEELAELAKLGDMGAGNSEFVVALDGVAVVVNPANRVDKLSIHQLQGLFSGKITDWSMVGGTPGPVRIHARDEKSGTFDTFKTLVLNGDRILDTAKRYEDSQALSDAVAEEAGAIGFVGLPYIRKAKAIAVSADARSMAMRPTKLTVATEDYPLTRRLFLYVPADANAFARKFADFAISDMAQGIADQIGFVGQVPEEVKVVESGVSDGGQLALSHRKLTAQAQRLSVNLRFRFGSADLDNKALQDVKRLVRYFEKPDRRDLKVMLLGFADNIGSECINLSVSQKRADTVSRELESYGVKAAIAHGFGELAPVADNATDTGREKNRRVEVWITRNAVAAPGNPSCDNDRKRQGRRAP